MTTTIRGLKLSSTMKSPSGQNRTCPATRLQHARCYSQASMRRSKRKLCLTDHLTLPPRRHLRQSTLSFSDVNKPAMDDCSHPKLVMPKRTRNLSVNNGSQARDSSRALDARMKRRDPRQAKGIGSQPPVAVSRVRTLVSFAHRLERHFPRKAFPPSAFRRPTKEDQPSPSKQGSSRDMVTPTRINKKRFIVKKIYLFLSLSPFKWRHFNRIDLYYQTLRSEKVMCRSLVGHRTTSHVEGERGHHWSASVSGVRH